MSDSKEEMIKRLTVNATLMLRNETLEAANTRLCKLLMKTAGWIEVNCPPSSTGGSNGSD